MTDSCKCYTADDNSICLLTSLLVRYPEIGTIKFSPEEQLIKLSFIIRDVLKDEVINELDEELYMCMCTYMFFLKKRKPEYYNLNCDKGLGISVVEITRDTTTLTQKELSLIINYLNDKFYDKLIEDENSLEEDYLVEQDDIISYILDNMRSRKPEKKVIAVREEGRVLVFQR